MEELTRKLDEADGRSRQARRGMWIGLAVALIALAGMVASLAYAKDAKATANDIVQVRNENRLTACVNENKRAAGERDAFRQALLSFIPPGTQLTPAQQASLDRYTSTVVNALPFRDCSPEGIAAYYAKPVADPAVTTTTG